MLIWVKWMYIINWLIILKLSILVRQPNLNQFKWIILLKKREEMGNHKQNKSNNKMIKRNQMILNLKKIKILLKNKVMHKIWCHLLNLDCNMHYQKINKKLRKHLKRKVNQNYKPHLVVLVIDTFQLKQFY